MGKQKAGTPARGAPAAKKSKRSVHRQVDGAEPPQAQDAALQRILARMDKQDADHRADMEALRKEMAERLSGQAGGSGQIIVDAPVADNADPPGRVSGNPPVPDPHVAGPSAQPVEDQSGQFNTSSIEVGSEVPANIRANIAESKYVCFFDLLKRPEARHNHTILDVDLETGTSKTLQSPVAPTKKWLSFPDWVAAWNIFSTIFLTARGDLELHGKLAIHLDQVLELHREGGHWRYYDEEFRRQVALGKAKWGQIHAQALNKSYAKGANVRQKDAGNVFHRAERSPHKEFRASHVPNGYCRYYNVSGVCDKDNCPYQHRCCNCRKDSHAAINCRQPISLPFRSVPAPSHSKSNSVGNNKLSNGRGGAGANGGGGK